MRALLSRVAGGPESLEMAEVAVPEPGPEEIRIKIAAAALNYPDGLMIADRYQVIQKRPYIPSGEFAGTIDAMGQEVKGLRPGDRVVALSEGGGLAEYALAKATRSFCVPGAVSLEAAAALMVTYGTSHHALKDHARIAPGETLLVLGAAGGVGLATVQLGKVLGARVIAGASSPPEGRHRAVGRGR